MIGVNVFVAKNGSFIGVDWQVSVGDRNNLMSHVVHIFHLLLQEGSLARILMSTLNSRIGASNAKH